ncbi:hypothetical protein GCM10022223_16140 [Kineosporia mesophila]|uniref:Uncharacterized protein n=1 Tax=Kineosporia mesophila TaxID=566012 RepID=A0ABP6Z8J5_9ACTN|nr:hypothetical protein [Kineosporia mesophila]MCD5354905.1 hypothetical protein [Kineosporia mesophila]
MRQRVHWAELLGMLVLVGINAWVVNEQYGDLAKSIALVVGVAVTILEVLSYFEVLDEITGWRVNFRQSVNAVSIVASVVLVCLVVWPVVEYFRSGDVTDRVMLENNLGIDPGEEVGVRVDDLPGDGRDLKIAFAVKSQNPDAGFCEPFTYLETTDPDDPERGRQNEDSNFEFTFPTGASGRALEFAVVVRNENGDQNCAVNVTTEKAELKR